MIDDLFGEYEAMYFLSFRLFLKTQFAHMIMNRKQDIINI